METETPLTPAQVAFWLFVDACREAALTPTNRATLLDISRQAYYQWLNEKTAIRPDRRERIALATQAIREAIALKRLPAMDPPRRDAQVDWVLQEMARRHVNA